jgi:hypothetical protein
MGYILGIIMEIDMEVTDLKGGIENKKHYGIFIGNIVAIIAGYPAWWAIYRLNHPVGYAGGDGAGLAEGGILMAIWLGSALISTLIALITFLSAIIGNRKTIGKGLLIFTYACLACSISSLLVIPILLFLKITHKIN